ILCCCSGNHRALHSFPTRRSSDLTMTLVAQPASASERDGKCDKGEFCYYYNSNNKGSISDHTKSVPDLGAKQPSCYEFKGVGNEIGRASCMEREQVAVGRVRHT